MKEKELQFKDLLIVFVLCFIGISYGQDNSDFIIKKFEDYSAFPREYTYVHLNKSIYIKGEMMGFSAYVFDKFDRTPSTATTNLYCVVKDSTKQILKKKLIRVKDGVASNVINIDSTFTSGIYTVDFYTNWMQNFDENNYFTQNFTVIDPEKQQFVETTSKASIYDIQVLAEGGHLVENIQNTIAIIVKDQRGLGIKNASGRIVDMNNDIITEFQLDNQGIGKTILKPLQGESYKLIILDPEGDVIEKPISSIEAYGINMSISPLKDDLIVTLRTNDRTLKNIKSEIYTIGIHNGKEMVISNVSFDNEPIINQKIKSSSLFSGINVITVFNQQNQPILERLYFNHSSIKISEVTVSPKAKVSLDTVKLQLLAKTIVDTSKLQNISISILPENTKSYNFDGGIASRIYLEPYVRGYIENASYYFSQSTPKIRYDLDNLLLAQGWSSYDWKTIFSYPPLIRNDFEFGISIDATINSKNPEGSYFSYPIKNNTSEIFVLDNTNNTFSQKGLFPEKGEVYRLSKGDSYTKPGANVRFFPYEFPVFDIDIKPFNINDKNVLAYSTNSNDGIKEQSWKDSEVEELDEVVLTLKKRKTRIESLGKKHFGKIALVTEDVQESNITLDIWLQRYNYLTRETPQGDLLIIDPTAALSNGGQTPLIYLDDVLLSDARILLNFRMEEIDYVVMDKQGGKTGIRGAAGELRIYTRPLLDRKLNRENVSEYPFPLAFETDKTYFTPKYQLFDTPFFRDYGVISWQPNLKFEAPGRLDLKFFNTETSSIKLLVEGFINGDTFISEVKTVDLSAARVD